MALYEKPSNLDLIWASEGEIVEPDATGTFSGTSGTYSVQTGWQQVKPPYQVENWIQNQQSQFAAYINQRGIPGWDAETEYQAGVSLVMGTNGVIYKCIATHSGRDPSVGNPSYWDVFEGNRQATTSSRGTVRLATLSEVQAGSAAAAVVTANTFYTAQATEGNRGVAEIATQTEVNAGNDTRRIVTPATLDARAASTSLTGLIALANQGEVQAGSSSLKAVTPATLATRTATETRAGLIEVANQTETNSGVSDEKAITPAKLRLGISMNLTGSHKHVALPSWLGGVVINWGNSGSLGGGASTVSVTYSQPFSDSAYGLSVSGVFSSGSGNAEISPLVNSKTSTGATFVGHRIAGSDSDFVTVSYIAIGT